jgi:polysaccharide biosynthesis protein PslH
MKILWLSHLVPYPPKAGVIQRSYHLLRQLSMAHEVHLLAFHQPALMNPLVSDPRQGLDEAIAQLGLFCQVKGVFPIPSDRSRISKALLLARGAVGRAGYTMNWLRSGAYHRAVRQFATEHEYSLLHCDTISLAPYASDAPRVPTVLDHHNVESHMMARRAGNEAGKLKRIYFSFEAGKLRNAERTWCTAATHNITCSDTDGSRLLDVAPGASVSTIANGVDTDHFSPLPRSGDRHRLLFIGTMNWYPNVRAVEHLICEIWPLLRGSQPHLGIDIVGANPPSWLVDLAASEPRILFHGFVEDIRPIMSDALAFICPIEDGGGTKLKVLNALAMALPLIAHPIACEGIDVENGKSVLFAQSPAEFAEAVAQVGRDPDLRHRLGTAGRRLAEQQYSVDAVGVKLRELYAAIASGGGVRRLAANRL